MSTRFKMGKVQPAAYKAMDALDNYVSNSGIDKIHQELIRIRASQINGCGYCIDYHTGDALKQGETAQRLFAISAWWETPFFTAAERAALKLAEEITKIQEAGLREDTFQNAKKYFSEGEIAQLIFITTVTNSWNRIAISMHMIAE